MPVIEPTVIAGDIYAIRHIGPTATVWPDSPATPVVVLANTTMVARPLPNSPLPTSPDFASGSWTGRLGDAGEAALTFPNKEASDGLPWRQRFDPTGHLQFVEITRNGEIDFCGVIDKIPTVSQSQVQIHASDGAFLLRKAYERDWTVIQAPRDIIERGTQVWAPTAVDDFPPGSLNPEWTPSTANGGSVAMGANGGVTLTLTSPTGTAQAQIANTTTVPASSTWRSQCTVQTASIGSGASFTLLIQESTGTQYFVQLFAGYAYFGTNKASTEATQQIQVAAAPSYSLLLESDGEWVWGFVNGRFIGCSRRLDASTTTAETVLELVGTSNSTVTITTALTETLQPFLQRGTDKGDYVLPGDASTYPVGGLTARYFNDLDLQSDSNALAKVLAPTRRNAYLGSGGPEYMDQQDATIYGANPPGFSQSSPGPGSGALANWSAIWSGAIYLKLSAGSYSFQLNVPAGSAGRLWIGKTQFGTQAESWTWAAGAVSIPLTVSASSLAGTLPYDGGTVARDGWYPIKIEFATGSTANSVPDLMLTSSPAAYTDPGGTSIVAGSQNNPVPASSLSPLGCVEQRYQGVSHFDLVQQTAQAYGYQWSVEPKQLESGLFPGVLAPRVREGHDTDLILTPNTGPSTDGENILNYSSGLDATDFAANLQGNGAGFQNGNTGQLQAMVYDAPTLQASLFDVQQWQDFSDASFASLLHALLNSQLALQLEPWQLLSADPNGRPRQAFTWPLTGALANMNWRPGDGLRIHARDINVWDTTPRQMLTITRNILPNGISSTQAAFAQRPRTPAHILKQQLYKATRWARNYQRQKVTIVGNVQSSDLAAATTDSNSSTLLLLPNDALVAAWLRVTYNSADVPFDVFVNGSDATNTLGSTAGTGWTTVPLILPLMSVAAPNQYGQLVVQLHNNSPTTSSVFQYQVTADVLR